ncbi:MAG: nucleotide pyrophosphohydrolase [Tumebacillaceae bacterium]
MAQESLEAQMTLAELKAKVGDFLEARNWGKAHSPKNVAMSIAIEAAELMEHFQWGGLEEYRPEQLSAEKINEIRLEVADVMIYMLSFCRTLGIDIAQAVQDKLEINETRFPALQVRDPE